MATNLWVEKGTRRQLVEDLKRGPGDLLPNPIALNYDLYEEGFSQSRPITVPKQAVAERVAELIAAGTKSPRGSIRHEDMANILKVEEDGKPIWVFNRRYIADITRVTAHGFTLAEELTYRSWRDKLLPRPVKTWRLSGNDDFVGVQPVFIAVTEFDMGKGQVEDLYTTRYKPVVDRILGAGSPEIRSFVSSDHLGADTRRVGMLLGVRAAILSNR